MHLTLAEVPVALPAAAELLGPILALSALVFVLGCVVMIDGLVRSLFGAVASLFSGIPGVGGLTSSAIHKAEQAISNALGTAIAGLEGRIAIQWHNLARAAERLWNYQVGVAENLWHLTQWVAGGGISKGLERLVARAIHRIETLTKTVTHNLTRIVHVTKVQVESVAHGVYPRIRALEHEVTRTLPREIRSARALAREAEDGVARLWKAVRAIPTTAEIAGIVAAAIAAIGLPSFDWFRCSNAAKTLGRGCSGLWGDLESILGLLADTVLLANVCTILPILETAVSDVADPLVIALTDVGAGLCSGGIGPAPALPVPALSTPAAPDATIYLP